VRRSRLPSQAGWIPAGSRSPSTTWTPWPGRCARPGQPGWPGAPARLPGAVRWRREPHGGMPAGNLAAVGIMAHPSRRGRRQPVAASGTPRPTRPARGY